MEYLFLSIVILLMVTVFYLKNKITDTKRLLITLIAGPFLILWFWIEADGIMFFQILVTVIVIGSLIEQIINFKKKSITQTPESGV